MKKEESVPYIRATKDMYKVAKTGVRTSASGTEFFLTEIRLDQGSALRLFLFL